MTRAALFLLLAVPLEAMGQDLYAPSPVVGLYGGYHFDGKNPIVGGRISVPLGGRLDFLTAADAQIGAESFSGEISLNGAYRSGEYGATYIAAGVVLFLNTLDVGFSRQEDTMGFNFAVGRELRRGVGAFTMPLLEARVNYSSGAAAVKLVFGFNFLLQ